MSFSQSAITAGPFFAPSGNDLIVSWQSSAAAGTLYQLYLDGTLTWWGTATQVILPLPSQAVHIDVGTVAAGEGPTDFSGSLPSAPPRRVQLAWTGGTWESPTIAGYHIYQSDVAGGAIDYTKPVATVPFQTGAQTYDGYGRGGYGAGGYGAGDASFSWTSDPLATGTWSFAVVPFDTAGNEQASHLTISQAVTARPAPPAPDSAGRRLTYTLSGTTPTLNWNASP